MTSDLQRDLGLPATTAIAIGAMVGSGIFILPGIAYASAGPAVVVAYAIAGLLVLPAALSASEMATAMPEDGGSYVYVERGMGPLLGTIAGIGNWFMLSFKGALALIGGVPYLVYVAPGLAEYILPIALGLALLFTILNVVSTKSTGSLQFAIVGVMMLAMGYFVIGGFPDVTPSQTAGSFDLASEGILAATGLVFVSYAGVIKVAAVAEEVKDPGTTIPRAMIGSLLATTALYVLIVYVAIGVAPDLSPGGGFVPEGGEEVASIAYAAEAALGELGAVLIVIAALLALASTANAGLLSASRFPFAMARDGLVPERFEHLHDRFKTPAFAVAVTGGVMMVMIATLPIEQVAKFGSAFQILVFILVNLAIVGFREGAVEDYDPEFVAPLYPWTQLAGMAGGVIVLTQMGTVPFLGAVAITLVSIAWYVGYARPRIDREGAARAGARENVSQSALDRTRDLFESDEEYDVLVAITDNTSPDARRDLLRMATDMGRLRSTTVSAVEFVDVPHQMFDGDHADVFADDPPEWLPSGDDAPSWFPENHDVHRPARTSGGATDADRPPVTDTHIEYREIDSEDHNRAIVDFATYGNYDLIVAERDRAQFHRRLFGGGTDWLLKNAPCDVMLVDDDGFDDADEIAVVANRGAYDPLKLLFADAVAEETGAELNLLQAIAADAPETQRETIERYHEELFSLLTVPARSTVIETDDEIAGLTRFVGDADLLVTGVDRTGMSARFLGRPGNRLVERVDTTAVMVQTRDGRRPGLLQRLLLNYLFG
ncbi:amino acid permease [Natronobacterium gregoryi]|uniref:Amino acid permease n=2 Tax=Natronobacterium gregoryi TaxID=44930 RepID=L0AMJ0_NATGS|nr:amino acid permease [Natronobacterium gregoryi]AFZ74280.1 amino acid transporter [Natronobacterium gregoryi SP2]ELY63739.1 amino acid permease-associated protein [Natronobacterium gregoryi SP2]PLK22210.1 amino acid permease [Natronobacterium gregoryi SP2]SFI52896.1 amino acid/polyamine/organocation transporter, APC superfamily [Natronobacterium gregoryi]